MATEYITDSLWLEQWGAAVGEPVDAVKDEEEDGGEQQEQSPQTIHYFNKLNIVSYNGHPPVHPDVVVPAEGGGDQAAMPGVGGGAGLQGQHTGPDQLTCTCILVISNWCIQS